MNTPWMEIAEREVGTTEVNGSEDNPRIVEYHTATSLRASDDETPWCSSFVNWCFKQAGFKGTGLANARSWLEWGKEIDKPEFGCVVIFKRGNPPSGHVAFYAGPDSDPAYLRCLGGNQSDMVRCSKYAINDVLGYRLPV